MFDKNILSFLTSICQFHKKSISFIAKNKKWQKKKLWLFVTFSIIKQKAFFQIGLYISQKQEYKKINKINIF